MIDERWVRVKALFQEAVERPVAERSAFVAAAAADDEPLRHEVETLLAVDETDADFLEAFPVAAERALVDALMSASPSTDEPSPPLLNPGQSIGPYVVVGLLGAGAMGEVYRARDTTLNREVALKVLPALFALNRDRLMRFRREAQVLASLNHQNIAAIYEFEESSDVPTLVLELVEGPTLGDRVARAPFPLDEALPIARQIAEALEAAHGQGIVHRDFKPSNVHVRPDGVVKVLDFGLAKALAPDAFATPNPSATRDGVILGTAAYMAPEQARGQAVDERADIWAFGCVLFEMLAGRPPFRGETFTDLLAAVVKDSPDWDALPRGVPPRIRALLDRCLKKDPRQRLQAIGDARIEIEEAERNPRDADRPSGRSLRAAERAGWIAMVTVLALLATYALDRAIRPPPQFPETRLEIQTPSTTDPASMAISPDGQKIVFSAASADGQAQLWIRPLTSAAARPLPQTEGARHPFWSPNADAIGFFVNGRLKRMDSEGRSLREIADAPLGLGGTWSRDDTIVFAPNWVGPLLRVSAGGGQPVAVTQLTSGQTGHRFPHFLPDGRHFLFECIEGGGISGVVYVGDLGGEAHRLVESGAAAIYASSGHLLFARGAPAAATLVAQKFDPDRRVLIGDPIPMGATVITGLEPGSAALSVSDIGLIAYRADSGIGQRQFVWFDRTGKQLGALGNADDANPLNPALSPDGRLLAVRRSVGENTDIWLLDTRAGLLGRLTASTGLHNFPVWSPDGRSVAFTANPNRGGVNDLYRKSADGTGGEELLLSTPQNKGLADWSSDGRFIAFRSVDPTTGNDIWAMSLADRRPFPVVRSMFDERDAQFSPDGRWIAYQSNETGSFEVWLHPFPGPGRGVRISNSGGTQVRWRRDGRELFYIAADGKLMAVPIENGPLTGNVEPGGPTALFATHIGGAFQGFNRHQYAVAPDGQRFLMNTVIAEATSTITVIQNWKEKTK